MVRRGFWTSMMRGRRPRPRSIFNPLGLSISRQASLDAVTKGVKEGLKETKKPGEHVCAYHPTRRKLGYRRKW